MTLNLIGLCVILFLMFVLLIKEWIPAEITVFLALSALILTGIQNPLEGLSGFKNHSLQTVANLFIIGAAVSKSGDLHSLVEKSLQGSKSIKATLFRIMLPTSLISAFVNNTPLVVILLPSIKSWALSNKISPSKLLLPLSYAAILGGTITLIGASTNILIQGLLVEKGLPGFHLFNLAYFGLPITIAGIIYFISIGHHLLPDRQHPLNRGDLSLLRRETVPMKRKNKLLTWGILGGVIMLGVLQEVSIYELSSLAAVLLVLTRTISLYEAFRSINLKVLLLMGSSIGIGNAIESTGLATTLSKFILQAQEDFGLFGILILYYLATSLLTEILNNLATAALMFPIGFSLSESLALDPMILATITVMAASCSFLTPIGYQTNMLVYRAGHYKFIDYFKAGLPLSLICMTVTLFLTYLKWF